MGDAEDCVLLDDACGEENERQEKSTFGTGSGTSFALQLLSLRFETKYPDGIIAMIGAYLGSVSGTRRVVVWRADVQMVEAGAHG